MMNINSKTIPGCYYPTQQASHVARPFERRRFFEGLGGCRRRGASGGWEQQPVAEAVAPGWWVSDERKVRVEGMEIFLAES